MHIVAVVVYGYHQRENIYYAFYHWRSQKFWIGDQIRKKLWRWWRFSVT